MAESQFVDVHLDGYGGFIEMAKDFALISAKDGEMPPILLLWNSVVGQAQVAFLELPFENEREKMKLELLLGQLRKDGVPYLLVTEAWWAEGVATCARDNPDRKECLSLQGVDLDGYAHLLITSIDGPENKRTFGEWKDYSKNAGNSRFTGPAIPSLKEVREALKAGTVDDLDRRQREKGKMERNTNRQNAGSN